MLAFITLNKTEVRGPAKTDLRANDAAGNLRGQEDAERLAKHIRQRTASQRIKKREVIERVARINRILLFMRHGETAPDMSETDLTLCKSIEDKLRGRAQS